MSAYCWGRLPNIWVDMAHSQIQHPQQRLGGDAGWWPIWMHCSFDMKWFPEQCETWPGYCLFSVAGLVMLHSCHPFFPKKPGFCNDWKPSCWTQSRWITQSASDSKEWNGMAGFYIVLLASNCFVNWICFLPVITSLQCDPKLHTHEYTLIHCSKQFLKETQPNIIPCLDPAP